MDRDTFIITVYCLVVEHYGALAAHDKVRHGGFAPALTDEEVSTMEICGEYFKHNCDKDRYDYFSAHYRHFFPRLPERSLFVRQAANLWQLKAAIQQRLVDLRGQGADTVQAIDTLPLPIGTYTRALRDRCFATTADYGYCAAQKLPYYGFKLGLRISRLGMITHYPLLAARPHDRNHLGALIEGFPGLVPADKGFIDESQQQLWEVRQATPIVTPVRSNMEPPPQPQLVKQTKRWRKLIETVHWHLTERFGIARTRAHDLWHDQHRLIRKVLAHTVMVFLNLQLNRQPLDLDGLVVS